MRNKFKISSIVIVLLMISVIVTPITAAEIPEGLIELQKDELSDIQGMGQSFSVEQIDSNNVSFRYSGNQGNAFQHASGVMNITNVSGDGNIIKNIVDLKINIYNIDEVESLDYSDISNVIDIE